ncbi:hypothetical protein JCM16303_003965 [Sporobolomyces ruberrimus]
MLRLVSMVWENKLKKDDSNSRISSSTSSIDLRLTYLDRQAYRTTDNPGLVRLKISSSEGLRQLSLVGLSVSSLVARRQAASIGVVLPGDMQASYAYLGGFPISSRSLLIELDYDKNPMSGLLAVNPRWLEYAPAWSVVNEIIERIISQSKRYEPTMSRVQALLKSLWTGCDPGTREKIRKLLVTTLEAVRKHVGYPGSMVRELAIEEQVGVGNWASEIPRDVLDQALNVFDELGRQEPRYGKMREAILHEPGLYDRWVHLGTAKRFEIVKRLWDLHQRFYERDTLEFKVNRKPLKPQELLNGKGYFPPHSSPDGAQTGRVESAETGGEHDWYHQLLHAAGMTESEWRREQEQKSRQQAQSPFVAVAQNDRTPHPRVLTPPLRSVSPTMPGAHNDPRLNPPVLYNANHNISIVPTSADAVFPRFEAGPRRQHERAPPGS